MRPRVGGWRAAEARGLRSAAALLLGLVLLPWAPGAAAAQTWEAWLAGGTLAEAREGFAGDLEEGGPSGSASYGLAHALLLSGERERAFAAALEGLRSDPGSPVAFALLDLVEEDLAFDALTLKLGQEALAELAGRPEADPYLRFRARWDLLRMAPRSGDPSLVRLRREACGFARGAFFSEPVERLARLSFLSPSPGEDGGPPLEGATYWELEGPQVRPPAYRMGEGGECLFTAVVPFTVASEVEALLYFNSSRSFRAVLDGKVLFEKNVFEDQANPTTLWRVRLAPGLHRLFLKVHASGPSDGVNLALLDGSGGPLSLVTVTDRALASRPTAPSKSLGPAAYPFPGNLAPQDPLRAPLDALFQRWQGDVAAGRRALEEHALAHPDQLLWNLLAAGLYLFEADDLPEKIAQSRAERVLDSALAVDPSCPLARYYGAVLLEAQTESGEDLLALKELVQEHPEDPRWGLRLVSRLAERGWRHEGLAVLEDLELHHPQCPQVLWARVGYHAQLPDRAGERQSILRLEATGAVPEAWESYLTALGDWEALKENLQRQAELYGDRDLRIAKRVADTDYRAGRFEEARRGYERLAEADPVDPGPALTAARCAFLAGDREGGFALLDAVKARRPDAFQVDLARWAMGEELPFESMRLPLERVLAEDVSDGPEESPSSLILDQQFGRVQSDGSSVERYHGVIRINDKEGVDREGEQAFEGQVVLVARSVKPDGTVLEPEQIPEKRTLSMSGLEPGDLVEVEYITLRPPNRIREGTYLTSSVFLFQDINRPFHRTQWWLEYPADLPMRFAEQNLPAPGQRFERDGLRVANWDYRSMPRIAPEPDTPNRSLYVPLVEAVGGLGWKDIALFLKDSVTGSFQKTPELRDAYRRAVEGVAPDPEARLEAILRFAFKEVEGDEDGSWQDPTETLLNRQGSRIPLVAAFLDLAGIRWEILLCEPVPNRTFRDDLPRLGTYQLPVLRVHLGSKRRDLVLASPYRAVTPLPWYLQGAKGLSLLAPDPSAVLELATDFSAWRAASERQRRTLLPSGDLELSHEQTFDPDTSQALRNSLNQLAKDQWEQVLQMALSRQMGSVDLRSSEIRGMDDSARPFSWSYEVLVREFATSDGGRLVVSEPIPALHLSRAIASLKERKLPLAPQGVTFVNQEYALTLPEGFETDYAPRKTDLKTPFGSYRLEVRREGRTFTFTRVFELPFQVVPPERYPEFARFLEEADRAEAGQMVLQPVE